MKLMKKMMNVFHKNAVDRDMNNQRRAEQYYDNYTMLGTVLGGYCGMFNNGKRKG